MLLAMPVVRGADQGKQAACRCPRCHAKRLPVALMLQLNKQIATQN